MIDHSTSRATDEVPEADLVEQSVPAYPDDPVYSDDSAYSDEGTQREDITIVDTVDQEAFGANPADVVEQSIRVPLDDDHDPGSTDSY